MDENRMMVLRMIAEHLANSRSHLGSAFTHLEYLGYEELPDSMQEIFKLIDEVRNKVDKEFDH